MKNKTGNKFFEYFLLAIAIIGLTLIILIKYKRGENIWRFNIMGFFVLTICFIIYDLKHRATTPFRMKIPTADIYKIRINAGAIILFGALGLFWTWFNGSLDMIMIISGMMLLFFSLILFINPHKLFLSRMNMPYKEQRKAITWLTIFVVTVALVILSVIQLKVR